MAGQKTENPFWFHDSRLSVTVLGNLAILRYGDRGRLACGLYEAIHRVDNIADAPDISIADRVQRINLALKVARGENLASDPALKPLSPDYEKWSNVRNPRLVQAQCRAILDTILDDARHQDWQPREEGIQAKADLKCTLACLELGSLLINQKSMGNPENMKKFERFLVALGWLSNLWDMGEDVTNGVIKLPLTHYEVGALESLPTSQRRDMVYALFTPKRFNNFTAQNLTALRKNIFGFLETDWPAWEKMLCISTFLASIPVFKQVIKYPHVLEQHTQTF